MGKTTWRLAIVIGLLVTLGAAPATAGRWQHRNVADAIAISEIVAADTTIPLVNWRGSQGGVVMLYFKETSIGTSGTAPTYDFKAALRNRAGTATWIRPHWFEGATAKTAAVSLAGSDSYFIYISPPTGLFSWFAPGPITGDNLSLVITKNNCNAGTLSAWIWWRQDD